MTPDACERLIARSGATVTLRRMTGTAPYDVEVPAKIRSFSPDELVGGITQADREVRIAHLPIARAQWPLPIRDGANADRVRFDGRWYVVQFVDPRNSISGETAMYVLRVRGG